VSPGRASGTLRRLSVSKPDRIGRRASDRIAPESCMQSIEQRVRKFLRETYPLANESELTSEQSLLDSGVLDSIGVLNLMTWLEREFDIYVEDHEVIPENIDGIGLLVRYVESKRAEAGLTG
jgi:acyl carrier protein